MLKKLLGNLKRNRKFFMLYSPLNGKIVQLLDVDDEVFSSGMLGKGIAFEPKDGRLMSPCSGVIGHVFETKHAINIISDFGCEILLHIGLDTVKLKGKGFDTRVKEGDRINKGDLLCVFDMEIIKNAGLSTITPMVITNSDDYTKIDARPVCDIHAGDSVLKIEK